MLVILDLPKGKPAVIIAKPPGVVNFLFLIIFFEISIICFQFLASLLVMEVMPQSNDNCLEIFIFGEIVKIFAEGLIAETNLAVFPETENAMIASTLML